MRRVYILRFIQKRQKPSINLTINPKMLSINLHFFLYIIIKTPLKWSG